jgi:CRP/FNR family transcriptional regulator, cyclic AMP receptor protein
MSTSLLQALAETALLAGLSPEGLQLVAQEGVELEFNAGDRIVCEGEFGHSLFIIIDGDVEVIKHIDSPHAVMLARLHRGTFFGEMCVVDPVPRTATVRALTPVKVIEVKAATLYHLFQQLPTQYAIMILNLARDMARRLRTIDEAYAARAC